MTSDNQFSAPARPRRRPGENRERLIEAGLIEFGLFGYHGASTAGIAARAEVPQPHVYASFPSKRELFLAVVRRVAERVAEGLPGQLADEVPGAAQGEVGPGEAVAEGGGGALRSIGLVSAGLVSAGSTSAVPTAGRLAECPAKGLDGVPAEDLHGAAGGGIYYVSARSESGAVDNAGSDDIGGDHVDTGTRATHDASVRALLQAVAVLGDTELGTELRSVLSQLRARIGEQSFDQLLLRGAALLLTPELSRGR